MAAQLSIFIVFVLISPRKEPHPSSLTINHSSPFGLSRFPIGGTAQMYFLSLSVICVVGD